LTSAILLTASAILAFLIVLVICAILEGWLDR